VQGFIRSWRATTDGLEGAAAGATDTVLILDDVGQVDAREMGAASCMLANGAGKACAARDGSLREPRCWRLLIISNGEAPVDAKLAEDRGRKPRAGQLVRMLDIPTSRAFGVLDSAGPDGGAAALADECKLAAMSDGTAGPEFVRRLIFDRVTGDEARATVIGDAAQGLSKKAIQPTESDSHFEPETNQRGREEAQGEHEQERGAVCLIEAEGGADEGDDHQERGEDSADDGILYRPTDEH
jgi:hypothetical protein